MQLQDEIKVTNSSTAGLFMNLKGYESHSFIQMLAASLISECEKHSYYKDTYGHDILSTPLETEKIINRYHSADENSMAREALRIKAKILFNLAYDCVTNGSVNSLWLFMAHNYYMIIVGALTAYEKLEQEYQAKSEFAPDRNRVVYDKYVDDFIKLFEEK